MGVNATFMYAFHIPVSITNVFLIVAAASVSSTVAIAPGAVGAQTALASVVLKGVAPQSAITAYSIGQQVITTAWNVAFGLTLLATRDRLEADAQADPLPQEEGRGRGRGRRPGEPEDAVAAEPVPPQP